MLFMYLFALPTPIAPITRDVPPAAIRRDLVNPPRPAWMSSEPNMQQQIDLDSVGDSIGEVLDRLSAKCKVCVKVERSLADYRLVLRFRNRRLCDIMGRIQDVFGHGDLPNDRYEWIRNKEPDGQLTYTLIRHRRAIEEEEALLDQPRQTCLRWLAELRRYAHLPQDKLVGFEAECPCLQYYARRGESLLIGELRPLGEAFTALTDQQFSSLQRDGHVDLRGLSFSDGAKSVLVQLPSPRPAATVRPDPLGDSQSGAELRIERSGDNETSSVFYMSVIPHDGTYCQRSFVFDTLRQLTGHLDAAEMKVLTAPEGTATIQPFPRQNPATNKELSDLPFETILDRIAEDSGSTLVAESFPKWPIRIDLHNGTVQELLTHYCAKAGYRWRTVGKDYLVFSRSWAMDRQADIPQRLVSYWQARADKDGRIVLDSLFEMAGLRNEQIKNLIHWVDAQGALSRSTNIGCLRILATLGSSQIQLAKQPKGLNVNRLDRRSIEFLTKEFSHVPNLPVNISFKQEVPRLIPIAGSKPYSMQSYSIVVQDGLGAKQTYWIPEPPARPLQSVSNGQ